VGQGTIKAVERSRQRSGRQVTDWHLDASPTAVRTASTRDVLFEPCLRGSEPEGNTVDYGVPGCDSDSDSRDLDVVAEPHSTVATTDGAIAAAAGSTELPCGSPGVIANVQGTSVMV
jgi:hypothetical protein